MDIPIDTIDDLLKVAVLTGSKAFNIAKKDSDYDFIISLEKAKQLNVEYKSCSDILDSISDFEDDNEYDEYLYGNKLIDIVRFINSEGKDINLFIYEDESLYNNFRDVNQYMISHMPEILDKKFRI